MAHERRSDRRWKGTDEITLSGSVTDAGFVARTHQVERIAGGWATVRRPVCHLERRALARMWGGETASPKI